MVAAARRQQPRRSPPPAALEHLAVVFIVFLGPAFAQQARGGGATAAAFCARIVQEGDCGRPVYHAELCPAECGGAAPGPGGGEPQTEPQLADGEDEGGQQLPLTCDEVASRQNCGVMGDLCPDTCHGTAPAPTPTGGGGAPAPTPAAAGGTGHTVSCAVLLELDGGCAHPIDGSAAVRVSDVCPVQCSGHSGCVAAALDMSFFSGAQDSSGNDHAAELVGSVCADGGGLTLRHGGAAQVSLDGEYTGGGSFTVAFWLLPLPAAEWVPELDRRAALDVLFSHPRASSATGGVQIALSRREWLSTWNLIVNIDGIGGGSITSFPVDLMRDAVPKWTHLVVSVDEGRVSMHVDSVLLESRHRVHDDPAAYTWAIEREFVWHNTTGAAVLHFNGGDDDGHVVKRLPWEFPWFGRKVRAITICTNGFISFRDPALPWVEGEQGWFGRLDPIRDRSLPIADKHVVVDQLAVFRTDLMAVAGSIWSYKAVADQVVISFENVGFAHNREYSIAEIAMESRFSFQGILHTTGDIEINYKNVVTPCPHFPGDFEGTNSCEDSLTIGFVDESGSRGSQIAYGWPEAPGDRTSIRISAPRPGVIAAPQRTALTLASDAFVGGAATEQEAPHPVVDAMAMLQLYARAFDADDVHCVHESGRQLVQSGRLGQSATSACRGPVQTGCTSPLFDVSHEPSIRTASMVDDGSCSSRFTLADNSPGERGTMHVTDAWQQVALHGSYNRPLVFAGIMSRRSTTQAVLRIGSVEATLSGAWSFRVKAEQKSCHLADPPPLSEFASYFVVEAGAAPEGWQAGMVPAHDEEWHRVSLLKALDSPPVLLTLVQNFDHRTSFVTSRVQLAPRPQQGRQNHETVVSWLIGFYGLTMVLLHTAVKCWSIRWFRWFWRFWWFNRGFSALTAVVLPAQDHKQSADLYKARILRSLRRFRGKEYFVRMGSILRNTSPAWICPAVLPRQNASQLRQAGDGTAAAAASHRRWQTSLTRLCGSRHAGRHGSLCPPASKYLCSVPTRAAGAECWWATRLCLTHGRGLGPRSRASRWRSAMAATRLPSSISPPAAMMMRARQTALPSLRGQVRMA
eukprot:SAG22_NODE_469_length_10143_cov_5.595181_7_plen_1082_part_00